MLDSAKESGVVTNQEVKKSADVSSKERKERTYVWLCGVLTLTPIILITLVLVSLPTVFYNLRRNQSTVRKIIFRLVSTSHFPHEY